VVRAPDARSATCFPRIARAHPALARGLCVDGTIFAAVDSRSGSTRTKEVPAMKTWILLAPLTIVLMVTATPALAQTVASSVPARSDNGRRAEIEQVQQLLKQHGHDPGRIDGVMGVQTTAALRAYQKEQGLGATGRLDEATRAKLGGLVKATGSEPQASPSSTQTGGSTKPSAVDPAQAQKTGANVGDGASYSRSTEKGQSTMKGADKNK
jgi:peptidoglycan hydrolase-like protein with peptidoglycan-binding domain